MNLESGQRLISLPIHLWSPVDSSINLSSVVKVPAYCVTISLCDSLSYC